MAWTISENILHTSYWKSNFKGFLSAPSLTINFAGTFRFTDRDVAGEGRAAEVAAIPATFRSEYIKESTSSLKSRVAL